MARGQPHLNLEIPNNCTQDSWELWGKSLSYISTFSIVAVGVGRFSSDSWYDIFFLFLSQTPALEQCEEREYNKETSSFRAATVGQLVCNFFDNQFIVWELLKQKNSFKSLVRIWCFFFLIFVSKLNIFELFSDLLLYFSKSPASKSKSTKVFALKYTCSTQSQGVYVKLYIYLFIYYWIIIIDVITCTLL